MPFQRKRVNGGVQLDLTPNRVWVAVWPRMGLVVRGWRHLQVVAAEAEAAVHQPVRMHVGILSPIHGQDHHNLQPARVWDGWWDGGMPPSPRSEQTGRTGRPGPYNVVSAVSRPRLNALVAPPTNHHPESSRNHPWPPAKSHGAESGICRYARNQYRLSDLSTA